MIQTRTKLTLKDNSGYLTGITIHTRNRTQSTGGFAKLALKARRKFKPSLSQGKPKLAPGLRDVLLVQTKRRSHRYDGSTVAFSTNGCVTINRSGRNLSLGFKRIVTSVPYELKLSRDSGLGHVNLIKLARGSF